MARKTRSLGLIYGAPLPIRASKDRMREGLHRCSQPADDVLDAPERIDNLRSK